MTHTDAAELVALLTEGFPSNRASLVTIQIYEKALMDLEYESGKRAVLALLKTKKFFPAIAEVYEKVEELESGPPRQAMDAYGDVNMATRLVGRYSAPCFEDPIVAKVVHALGWQNICDDTNEPALRARFLSAYNEARAAEQVAQRQGYTTLLGPSQVRHALPAKSEDINGERGRQLAELTKFAKGMD